MSELRFTKEHEWARVDHEIAVCGITDYAQHALGDIVYVELPSLGYKAVQGEQIAVVESAKAASEVYAPLDGEIFEVNDAIAIEPGKVNASPTDEGWFFKIRLTNSSQVDGLMTEAQYQVYLKDLMAA